MIAIIDYEAGNLASVSHALERLGADFKVTNQAEELDAADGIIFPGVGHAKAAMDALQSTGLDRWLKETSKPVLGICLGMQLLFDASEEGPADGLGIIPGTLTRFDAGLDKVPHMGWNTFSDLNDHPFLKGITPADHFYYVHSYAAPVTDYTIGACDYHGAFSAIVARDNFVGTQFHPEKSGKNGEKLLSNFLDIVRG